MPGKIRSDRLIDDNFVTEIIEKFRLAKEGAVDEFNSMVAELQTISKKLKGANITADIIRQQDDFGKKLEQTKQKQKEVDQATKIYNKTLQDYKKIQEQLNQVNGNFNTALQQNKVRLQAANAAIRLRVKEQAAVAGSAEQLRIRLQRLNKEWLSLTKSEQQNVTIGGKVQADINKTRVALDQMNKSAKSGTGFFNKLATSIRSYVIALLSIQTARQVIDFIYENTKALDRLRLSIQYTITENYRMASAQRFLADISQRFGLDLIKTSESFIRLLAATKTSNLGFKETKRVFESVAKAGSVLGLSAQRIELAFLAVEQIASKGTVSLEELRRQLGDQIPGAVNIMAKALNVTIPELYKMIKANQVLAEDALPKFARELEKTYGIENVERIRTVQAEQGRIRLGLQEIVKTINASETVIRFFEKVNQVIKTTRILIDYIGIVLQSKVGGYLKEYFEIIEGSLPNVFTPVRYAVKQISEETDIFRDIIEKLDEKLIKLKESSDQNAESQKDLSEKTKETTLSFEQQIGVANRNRNVLIRSLESVGLYASRINYYIKSVFNNLSEFLSQFGGGEQGNYIANLRKEINALEEEQAAATKSQLPDVNRRLEAKQKELESALQLGLANKELEKLVKEINKVYKESYAKTLPEGEQQVQKIIEKFNELKQKAKDAGVAFTDLIKLDLAKQYELLALGLKESEKTFKDFNDEMDDLADAEIKRDQKVVDEKVKNDEKEKQAKFNLLFDLLATDQQYYEQSLALLNEFYKSGKISDEDYLKAKVRLWVSTHKEIIDSVKTFVQQAGNALASFNEIQVIEAQSIVDSNKEAIDSLKSRIDEEKRLREQGLDNNVELLERELKEKEKAQKQALEQFKKTKKQEAQIEALSQASNLVLATTEIFAAESPKGLAGVLIAAGAIASMFAIVAKYKAQIKNLQTDIEGYAEGTEDLKRGKAPKGKDTILIRANEHERILTAEQNKEIGQISNDEVVRRLNIYKNINPNTIDAQIMYHSATKEMERKLDKQIEYLDKLVAQGENNKWPIFYENDQFIIIKEKNGNTQKIHK